VQSTHQAKWQGPTSDMIKLNCDGAFDASTGSGGWGFIARDAQGDARGSGAGRVGHITSAIHAQ
jgi:ribonuclease HI